MLKCGDSMVNLHMISNYIELSVYTTFGLCDGSKFVFKLFSVSCEDFVLHG